MTRKEFLAASAAFAMGGPRLVAATALGGRALKTPLMLDTVSATSACSMPGSPTPSART